MLTLVAFMRKVFRPDTERCYLLSVFTLFIISIVLFSLLYYFICKPHQFYSNVVDKKGKQITPVNEYFDLLYFSFITQSTTGFGDIAPKENQAKFIVMLQIISVLIIASL
jgi:hypothetical protein